ncbi:Emopamil-binding protein [Dimargaris cristalligena]|uniref:Emopamil-binding protein n=1 Tax=Dimargaris cristalligena TaxID=215637 RepID=A0A4P9ZN77_9FUNG|nr:Emopamil-binding protein [Dimargaris cristalligena]|eukprot:RKP34723.1 Emopamil-binding protein [Dimargaris cristalligena]
MSSHPFYPVTLALPHYVPPQWAVSHLLPIFFAAVVIVLGVAGILVGRVQPRLSATDRTIFLWLCLSAVVHLVLEGYYVVYHVQLAGVSSVLADLWKEYALADSRYLSADSAVLAVELITVVMEGPGLLFAAYALATRSPLRHPLQLIISVGQLYGSLVYMFSMWYDTWRYMTPLPYYYYFYFWGMNLAWVVVPSILICQSWSALVRFASLDSNTPAAKKDK